MPCLASIHIICVWDVNIMALKMEEKQAIAKLIKIIKDVFVVKQIILFGSKVRNDDTVDSDIDIILLIEEQVTDKTKWKISDLATEVEWDTGIYISCRVYNYYDWETENEEAVFLPFKDNIVRDGELLEV